MCLDVASQCESWAGRAEVATPGGGEATCDFVAPSTADAQTYLVGAGAAPGYDAILFQCVLYRPSNHAVPYRRNIGFAGSAFADHAVFPMSGFDDLAACVYGWAWDGNTKHWFGDCPSDVRQSI